MACFMLLKISLHPYILAAKKLICVYIYIWKCNGTRNQKLDLKKEWLYKVVLNLILNLLLILAQFRFVLHNDNDTLKKGCQKVSKDVF